MSSIDNKYSSHHFWIDEEHVPYFLKAFSENRAEFGKAKFGIESLPDGGWLALLTDASTRETMTFCAYVYAELPEDDGREVVPVPEEAKFDTTFLSEATAQEDDEEHFDEEPEEGTDEGNAPEDEEEGEEDEDLSDLSDTPEGKEVKAKLRKVKVKKVVPAERKLAAAATVVSTENKSVTIEGS